MGLPYFPPDHDMPLREYNEILESFNRDSPWSGQAYTGTLNGYGRSILSGLPSSILYRCWLLSHRALLPALPDEPTPDHVVQAKREP